MSTTEIEPSTEAASEVASTTSTNATAKVEAPAGADKLTREQLEEYHERAISDNVKLRNKNAELKKVNAELDAQARKAVELEESIPKIEQQARERVAKADFRARLRVEGISDPDVLKLLDLSAVKYDADGEPENADEVWTSFKEAKSYLFAGQKAVDTSSSSVHKAPAQKTAAIDWATASAEEVKAAMKPSRYKP